MKNKCRSNENELVKQNMGLVEAVVRSFQPPRSDIDDYIQHGCIGLLRAIRHHDPSKGRLITIAIPSIKWEIIKYIKKQNKYNKKIYLNTDIINKYPYCEEEDLDLTIYSLNRIEFDILNMKIKGGMTFQEISSVMHLSLTWVFQLYQRSLDKIRMMNK